MAEAIGWTGKARRALGALLAGLDATVYPVETGKECMDAITVKVRQGPTTPDQNCICRAQFVIAPYIDICQDASRLPDAYDKLDRLTGSCGDDSIIARLGSQTSGRWTGVALRWEGVNLGKIERVDPAVLYGLAAFNEDANNSVSAQIAVTVMLAKQFCCGGDA